MKKVMFVIMAALVFVACSSPSPRGEDGWGKGKIDSTKTDSVKVDTVGVELDSILVSTNSVMVLDSTVSKIGKE